MTTRGRGQMKSATYAPWLNDIDDDDDDDDDNDDDDNDDVDDDKMMMMVVVMIMMITTTFSSRPYNRLWNKFIMRYETTIWSVVSEVTWLYRFNLERESNFVVLVTSRSAVSIMLQFLPEASLGLRVLSLPASVCVSVRPSVRRVCGNHLLVRTITQDPTKDAKDLG